MTVSSIKVKVQRKATVKTRVIAQFPSSVTGTGGISVTKSGGAYTIAPTAGLIGDVVGPGTAASVAGQIATFTDGQHIAGSGVALANIPLITTANTWALSQKFTLAPTPTTNDGAALGTTALKWSDLFLASGAVLNFNAGDFTVTHSAGLLTFSGNITSAGKITAANGTSNGFILTAAAGNNGQLSMGSGGSILFKMGSTANAFSITDSNGNPAFSLSGLADAANPYAQIVGSGSLSGSYLQVLATTASTSSTTGALIVAGGAGIAGAANVGAAVTATGYKVSVNQVVGARVTGYAAMTGTPDKATAYATGSVTLAQLAGRVAQMQADLTTHGLIGA